MKKKCVKVIVFVLSHPEISVFVFCIMLCDIIRFVLRHFLGFLAGFYPFALQLIHFDKIRGLERLKMRCCYTGIRILMLLRYSKRGCCGNYARVQVCVYVYMYTL